jgi:hypothetical protein
VGPLQVGATLSQKYKIERLLAESGGAVLYEATDTARKQRVWIKIMQRESLGNAAAMARFQREAAGSKVLDVGKNDAGLPYMVATEFGPEKPAMPPRPKASKTTLRGVAPPPPPVPSKAKEEIEEAAPLSGSDVVIDVVTPPPPVLATPFVTPPLEPVVDVPDIPFVEDPVIELPAGTRSEPTMQRKRASAAATVFIDRPTERRSQTGVWIVALVLASVVTGGAGWYFGHKGPHAAAPASTAITTTVATTTVAAATTTEAVKIPEPPPPPTTPTTPPPPLATVTSVPAPVTTAARKPPSNVPRKPPGVTRPISGDPLTL